MKHYYLYGSFAIILALFSWYLFTREQPKTELTLMERSNNISNTSEWTNTKTAILKLIEEVKSNPNNMKAKMQLTFAYIQESRVSGNHSYYDKAAIELTDEILSKRSNDYEALCAKATILLSQHHFSDALEIGNRIIKDNKFSAFGYGILTDANLELGNYTEAVKCADKMVAMHPDLRSYSRVSYLREIFGDYEGAIDAMNMAVTANIPGTEQTEWARVYVGHLNEMTGNYEEAKTIYETALIHRPNYAYALAGLGRVAKAEKKYDEAIKDFNQAKFNVADYAFFDELSDIYLLTSKPAESQKELDNAIKMLSNGNGKESDSQHGHYADRELALLYVKQKNYDLALQHALTEYNRRPLNIDVNQTLAWVYYKRGEYENANAKITTALTTQSKNPVLLFQAGLIKTKSGNSVEGKKLILESLAINKLITADLMPEAETFINKNELIVLK